MDIILQCRICGCEESKRGRLRPIFTLEAGQTLASMMEELSGVTLSTEHDRSDQICTSCCLKIKVGHAMRKQIIEAERSGVFVEALDEALPSTEFIMCDQIIAEEVIGKEVKVEQVLEDPYEYEYLEEYASASVVDEAEAASINEDTKTRKDHNPELLPRRPPFVMPQKEAVVGVTTDERGYLRVEVQGDRCCGCSFVGVNRRELLQHSESEHSVTIVECGNYCPICFFKFATGGALTRHLDECKSRQILVCQRCNNYFNGVQQMEKHLRGCNRSSSIAEENTNSEEDQGEHFPAELVERDSEFADSDWEPTQSDLEKDVEEEEQDSLEAPVESTAWKPLLEHDDNGSCESIPASKLHEQHILRRVTFTTFDYVKLQHERCCGCDFTCKTREELLQHAYDAHERTMSVADIFVCPICCASFPTNKHVSRHVNLYTSKQMLICTMCDEAFSGRNQLKSHQQWSMSHAKYFTGQDSENRVELATIEVSAKLDQLMSTKRVRSKNSSISRHRHLPMPDTRFIVQIISCPNYETLTVSGERCCGCGQFFESYQDVQQHGRQVHLLDNTDANGEYQCDVCYSRFDWNRSLMLHKSTRRSVNKVYRCKMCHLVFSKKHSIERHLATAPNHSNKAAAAKNVSDNANDSADQYHCCFPKCVESFATESLLLEHCEFSHGGKRRENDSERTSHNNVCVGCCKAFENTTCLVWHRTTRFTKRYTCRFCHMVFNRWQVYREHENLVHLGKQSEFPCKTCNKVFRTMQRLKAHQVVHSEHRNEICAECGASFRNKGVLKRHRRTVHAIEFPFDCTDCARKFPTLEQLNAHSRVHTGVKPYSCRFCERAFSHFTDRKRHEMSTHTGERPYQCSQCSAAFIRNRELSIHMQKHAAESNA